jgi:ATP/maltotriose-dependent transcriptional regulator MalT
LANVRGIGQDVALLATAHFFGPTPVGEAIAACRRLLEEGRDHPFVAGPVITNLAALHAMDGDFTTAHRLKEQARNLLDDLSLTLFAASTAAQNFGLISLFEGDYAAAARELERGLLVLEAMGEKNYASTNAAMLAEARLMLGDRIEARRLEELARAYGAEHDLATQTVALSVQARLLALDGRMDEAVLAANEAVLGSERVNERMIFHASAVLALAEVLKAAGDQTRAQEEAERALAAFVRKGNRPMAARAQELIDALGGHHSPR